MLLKDAQRLLPKRSNSEYEGHCDEDSGWIADANDILAHILRARMARRCSVKSTCALPRSSKISTKKSSCIDQKQIVADTTWQWFGAQLNQGGWWSWFGDQWRSWAYGQSQSTRNALRLMLALVLCSKVAAGSADSTFRCRCTCILTLIPVRPQLITMRSQCNPAWHYLISHDMTLHDIWTWRW